MQECAEGLHGANEILPRGIDDLKRVNTTLVQSKLALADTEAALSAAQQDAHEAHVRVRHDSLTGFPIAKCSTIGHDTNSVRPFYRSSRHSGPHDTSLFRLSALIDCVQQSKIRSATRISLNTALRDLIASETRGRKPLRSNVADIKGLLNWVMGDRVVPTARPPKEENVFLTVALVRRKP